MRFPKPVWIAVALSALVGASGFVWLPAPLGIVERALAERAPGFTVAGRAHFRWASGEVRGEDLRLAWHDRVLVEAATVALRLDLRPGSESFGMPWRVAVSDGAVELDDAALDALARLRQEPSSTATIEVVIQDSRFGWTQPDGERLAGTVADARAIVRTGAALEAESAGEAQITLEQPTAAAARLRFRALAGRSAAASVVASVARADELARFAPALAELQGAIGVELHLHLGDGFQRVRATAQAAQVRHPSLPETIAALQLTAAGDLTSTLRVDATAATAHGRIATGGWLQRRPDATPTGFGGFAIELQTGVEEAAINAALAARLAEEAPAAYEVLQALGLTGVARARAGLRANVGAQGLEAGWSLAVAAPVAGLGVEYAGFPDPDGEAFAFPYPLTATGGTAAWSGGAVLVVAEAVTGEAGGDPQQLATVPTRVNARCAVELGETARTWLELNARAVRLGERVGAALQANVETGSLWFRLGAPHGEADADLVLRPGADGSTDWRLRLHGRDVQAQPPDLGLAVEFPRVDADVDRGGVRFTAEARTATANARLSGRVRAVAGRETVNEWAASANGEGYLNAEEREALAGAVGLPDAFVQIEPGGAAAWRAAARALLDGSASPPLAGLAEATLREASPQWPQQQAGGTGWTVRAAVAVTPDAGLLAVEPASGSWREARLQLGGAAWLPREDGAPLRGTLTASLFESPISQSEVHSALLLLRADQWATGLRFAGQVAGTVEVPLADPSAMRARLDLAPLHVVLQPGALGATAMREPTRTTLTGTLRLLDGAVSTQRLGLRGPDLDFVLEDASGVLDETGLQFRGVAVSARGARLRPQLEIVASQRVLDSLDRIGVDGRVIPQRVEFEVAWPSGGTPRATASGTLQLVDFDLGGPPAVRRGAGSVICEQFVWNGPEDFRGRFKLTNGSAEVAGVRVHDADAVVSLLPERVVVTDFEATTLDGHAFTRIPEADGSFHEGMFSLGLAGNAAVRADFGFEGFLLERMGEELGYRGPLAGRLDGRVDLRSADPSPLQYRGSARLHIVDGVLGAVPVLSQLWSLLGISTPVFREGRLAIQLLSEGRILVEELTLLHPLLEVTGERVITMDSYLGLKVTVRTLGFFGRLPLVRDLLDLIVEQDVYGPASAPRLRQRGLGKIFQGDPERVPFPLWVPRAPPPDRTRSPVLPAERVLAPRS